MISKDGAESVSTRVTNDDMIEIMGRAVKDALAESRAKGVPIPITVGEEMHYQLPDGTIVAEDPWEGKNRAPEGWYRRFGIEPPQ